jgi:hypothetical protein
VTTQRARLGVLIENLGPVGDEMSIVEKIAREVLGQQTYTDVEKRGSRLFAERTTIHTSPAAGLTPKASLHVFNEFPAPRRAGTGIRSILQGLPCSWVVAVSGASEPFVYLCGNLLISGSDEHEIG